MASAASEPLRVLFWNIRAGGGPSRAQAILMNLIDAKPAVIALAECRPTFAGQMERVLRESGWAHTHTTALRSRHNGILIATSHPSRWLPTESARLTQFMTSGVRITAVHVPDRSHASKRKTVFAEIHQLARERNGEDHLIIGDFNADRSRMPQEDGLAIGRLISLGFQDLWARQNPVSTEHTWSGSRGEVARIDHAYASRPLLERGCRVVHLRAPHWTELSDHSPLLVTLHPNDP